MLYFRHLDLVEAVKCCSNTTVQMYTAIYSSRKSGLEAINCLFTMSPRRAYVCLVCELGKEAIHLTINAKVAKNITPIGSALSLSHSRPSLIFSRRTPTSLPTVGLLYRSEQKMASTSLAL